MPDCFYFYNLSRIGRITLCAGCESVLQKFKEYQHIIYYYNSFISLGFRKFNTRLLKLCSPSNWPLKASVAFHLTSQHKRGYRSRTVCATLTSVFVKDIWCQTYWRWQSQSLHWPLNLLHSFHFLFPHQLKMFLYPAGVWFNVHNKTTTNRNLHPSRGSHPVILLRVVQV